MGIEKEPATAGEDRETQYTTIKVRIYPTPEQAEVMDKTIDCCRYLWNRMLADEQEFYAATDKHYIPAPARYKKSAPFLKEADSQALVAVHQNIQKAFRDFFTKPERFHYPTFKKKKQHRNTYRSYCHHYHGKAPDSIRIEGNGIVLPKVKWVKAKLHRRPEHWWTLQYATVSRNPSGKYYCSLLYQYRAKRRARPSPLPDRTLGIKYSVRHYYVDSVGSRADSPRWFRDSAEKLKEMQRRLSRMQPGSKNYEAQHQKLVQLYEHIANQRQDYIHKETTRIANAWDAVCIRRSDMARTARAMRYSGVLDSAFGKFKFCLEYKLKRQGKAFVVVDRIQPTTKTCHACGSVNESLNMRAAAWVCPHCGARLLRERNAAENIRDMGLKQLREEQSIYGVA
ncbi:MAG: transposase [Oscillospiraceae bacterium]|nr:transposase [Oscillospiraceae bacterium]